MRDQWYSRCRAVKGGSLWLVSSLARTGATCSEVREGGSSFRLLEAQSTRCSRRHVGAPATEPSTIPRHDMCCIDEGINQSVFNLCDFVHFSYSFPSSPKSLRTI
ncbi:hypothetical protein B0J13DRAFT_544150 [Dactylonectria estremocensis]|uniref:Uncharacterized protein n=1 Tax=Dactylonectria estremocensis TaxID=1079267 RepID=A0A9P9F4W8_9HYPO|nr:hypothetical protein B0J13DRAFT_544150 [Dactylonectria estremocensis]